MSSKKFRKVWPGKQSIDWSMALEIVLVKVNVNHGQSYIIIPYLEKSKIELAFKLFE